MISRNRPGRYNFMDQWKMTLQSLLASDRILEDSVIIPADLDFIDIVESLEPFMVHSDPAIRTKTAKIFSYSLKKKISSIDSDSMQVIKNFLIQKIDDAAVLIEVLGIFLALKAGNLVTATELISIGIKALKSVKVIRLGVENRLHVFKFLKSLLEDATLYASFSQPELSVEFFESFLNAIENEKDPRNLLVIFQTYPLIMALSSGADYVEELFESLFCYFPVTFRSNPSDPNLVTVEQLKDALKVAIASGRAFGDLAVQLLIEKLSTSKGPAGKVDSLEVLLAAVSHYDMESFIQFRYQLEIALFSEIISTSDSKVQELALNLIRILSSKLSSTEAGIQWMDKFLRESLSAIRLDSQEIIPKCAVLIEAVSSSNEISFQFALQFCLVPLLDLSKSSRVAKNCLVALLSPLKTYPQWISSISAESVKIIETFVNSLNFDCSEVGVYLVIFSFISPVLSSTCSDEFVSKFFASQSQEIAVSNEIKNCLWIASRSRPASFITFIPNLNDINAELYTAMASTPELTEVCVERLLNLKQKDFNDDNRRRRSENTLTCFIEDILLKSDLSLLSKNENLIIKILEDSSMSSVPLIKLLSKCSVDLQKLSLKYRMCEGIIAGRVEVLISCDEIIFESFTLNRLNSDAITSLFNKCPDIWISRLTHSVSHDLFYLSALKGLIYRCDKRVFDILRENEDQLKQISVDLILKLFLNQNTSSSNSSDSSSLYSEDTFHVCKSVHLQWFFNQQIQNDDKNGNPLLISVLVSAPTSFLSLNPPLYTKLILNFLAAGNETIESEVKAKIIEVLLKLLNFNISDESEVDWDTLLAFCLKNSNILNEPTSLVRFTALRVLTKMVQMRLKCCQKYQEMVVKELQKNCLNDPKRVVRQEAAQARNLWIVLKEEDIF